MNMILRMLFICLPSGTLFSMQIPAEKYTTGEQLYSYEVNQLIAHPEQARKKAYAIREKCEAHISIKKILAKKTIESHDFDLLNTNVQRYQKECPYFLLGECTQDGLFSSCALSREKTPQYRENLEYCVTKTADQKLKKSNSPLYYTSFGCGSLFQDLVILTKILHKNSTASIVINLIDKEMRAYNDACDCLTISRHVTGNVLPLETNMKEILNSVREKIDVSQGMNEEQIFNRFKTFVWDWELPLHQLLFFLKNSFGHAQITLFTHTDVDSYFHYNTQSQQPYPVIVVAADIFDDMSGLRQTAPDYTKICHESLKQNPSCKNFLLMDKGDIIQCDIKDTMWLYDSKTKKFKK